MYSGISKGGGGAPRVPVPLPYMDFLDLTHTDINKVYTFSNIYIYIYINFLHFL